VSQSDERAAQSGTDQALRRLTYSADEVAALLGLSRAKVYDAIRAGELPSLRFGRRVVVPVRALLALVGESPEPDGQASESTTPIASARASSAAGTAWA
jgi:excisionase family DNA binding protein